MNQELLNLLLKAVEIVKLEISNLEKESTSVVSEQPNVSILNEDKPDKSSELNNLFNLLNSTNWPEAVSEFLICSDSDDGKNERAEGILDYIGETIQNKTILDFGCGEGHVATKAAETAKKVIGYDIAQTGTLPWGELLTTDFSKVQENGPYDIIIMYDVLDHCKDPVAALKQIFSVCDSQTKIFVRCHSWMSRHGSHLYKQLNKAWAHLIFTEDELSSLGIKTEFIQKTYFPLQAQKEWFEGGGLRIIKSDIIKSIIEPFFRKKELSERLTKQFDGKFPEWQISQLFNDYVLQI